ncbi:MAG: MarR family transcriptional regulator [Chloroflexi bacterium]|nr:MarR family transcriptional regulator [Chloroflexota bacterium]
MINKISTDQVVDRYWEIVPPAWHRTRAVIREAAAEKFHLTVEQFQVLRRIRRGIASVSALADASNTSRGAVSKAVDALVNKGLVSRSQDPNDRRNIPLALTPEGERAMSTIFNEAEKWLVSRFEGLTDNECTALLEGLDLLRKAFSEG